MSVVNHHLMADLTVVTSCMSRQQQNVKTH